MKTCIPAVRQILLNSAPLMALIKVGTNPARIYLMRAEQFTSGGDIVISDVSGSMASMLEHGSSDPWEVRVSLDCRASTYARALEVSDAVKAALLPFSGPMSGLSIHGIIHASETGDYSDEATVFRHIVDFRVHYGPI